MAGHGHEEYHYVERLSKNRDYASGFLSRDFSYEHLFFLIYLSSIIKTPFLNQNLLRNEMCLCKKYKVDHSGAENRN